MKTTVSVEGLRELDAALGQLTKATARNTLRRVLLMAGKPMAATAQSLAPIDTGALKISIGVGTKLTKRQARMHGAMGAGKAAFAAAMRGGATRSEASTALRAAQRASGGPFAEVFVGAGGVPQATLREFGTDGNAPAPFMRPAWDMHKAQALDIIKNELGKEIAKTAARAAKRAAAKAAKAARG